MKTYILGNGGFAQEVFAQIVLSNTIETEFGGFVIIKDDEAILIGDEGASTFTYPIASQFILGTGNKTWRRKFISHFSKYYAQTVAHFPNIEAPHSYVSPLAKLGIGNLFMNFSMINGNAEMGNYNMFNPHASIYHDSSLQDNNVFSPYSGVMGYCKLGSENFLGTGTHITPKCSLGNENTLSAGETLFDDMKTRQFFQSGVIQDKP